MPAYPDKQMDRIALMHQDLGIPPSYRREGKLPLCAEPDELIDCGLDYYQRPQRLTPAACLAWDSMREAAHQDGIVLHLISAFRSFEYQHGLLRKKLESGLQLAEILKINAAPGYSEHHTGRAIDIGTVDCRALETAFCETTAFAWLERRAGEFRFSMSYPENNTLGISYEPWHWCFQV